MKIKDYIIQESKPDQTGQQDRTNPCLGQGCVLLLQREGGTFWKGLSAGRNDTHRANDSFQMGACPPCPHGDRRRVWSPRQSDPVLLKIWCLLGV